MNSIYAARPVYPMPPGVYAARRNLSALREPEALSGEWRGLYRIDLEQLLADLADEGEAVLHLSVADIWDLTLEFSQRARLLNLLARVGQ